MKPAVLIVDDSLTVRMDLGEAFELAGFETTLCSTLKEARDALSGGSFALIILDVILPDGDGIEFLREIGDSASTAGARVILLTSETEVRDRIRGLKTGADEYVGKPYDLFYLVARARELLRKERSSEEADSPSVLLIDDSPTFREELRTSLEESGYTVIAVATGEDGLRVAVNERPAAIIVDGVLPGIDGATVIRLIRADAALRRTPCLLLTASEEKKTEIAALDAGADDYVRKDKNIGLILARLAAILRGVGTPSVFQAPSGVLGPRKVLAVDDSITYLHLIGEQLRKEGYDVVLARSGEEALEVLAAQKVDCILLDLVMPGLTGEATCRRIKSSGAWRDIPLILHTSKEDQQAMIDGINAGADDYIAKSGDFEVLRARVRAQIRRKQFEDENRNIREQLLQKEMEIIAANSARQLAEARANFAEELEFKNQELETFSYSVSHDLRAPLRAISGFSQLLVEHHQDRLDADGRDLLQNVRVAAGRMGQLIDGLLKLARSSKGALSRTTVNLSAMAEEILGRLRASDASREATFAIVPDMIAEGDPALLAAVMENLLGNAWKFTGKQPQTRIEVGARRISDRNTFFVSDNGAGFNMKYADRLFGAFQRLHLESEFAGTGIGLATVRRIIQRHGGQVWAESAPGEGATFFFTLESGG